MLEFRLIQNDAGRAQVPAKAASESCFNEYIKKIQKKIAAGDATEHTHRPALIHFIETWRTGLEATNEPKRISCGAPDLSIRIKNIPAGYIETKDVGTPLDDIERGKGAADNSQFKRYLSGLPNWILTDYLDFRWYVNGKRQDRASLGTFKKGKFVLNPGGQEEVEALLNAFYAQESFTIGTPKELATHLAALTRMVRTLTVRTFEIEKAKGWLHNMLNGFREVLIPDLSEDDFADMFAQTVSYGMFAARVHTTDVKGFSRITAADSLPKTNPFLRKFFSEVSGVEMPDSIRWAVDDLADLLRHADFNEILKNFGKGTGKHDPVVHFYETFLKEYDAEVRETRGVYYTPEPVVSYIVQSVDVLLKKKFGRDDGLSDENTMILDPAVGTATFLYFVVKHIADKFEGQAGAWDSYVSEHLLNRIFGFELLMAPYAVAHLKLGLQLKETGYKFKSGSRLGIYLTNTLEEAVKKSQQIFGKWISDEVDAAADIKQKEPILVIIGNPPYFGKSANRSDYEVTLSPGATYNKMVGGPNRSQMYVKTQKVEKTQTVKLKTFIGELMDDYYYVDDKPLGERNPKWLQNDYVKFIRFAEWRLAKEGEGIIGFITAHSYIDNPTFRGMRQHLMSSFNEIYVYDLHGDTVRHQQAPDGGEDVNVFDIQQGVSILLCVKEKGNNHPAKVFHADLWGSRESKYEVLQNSNITKTKWTKLEPSSPFYLYVPQDDTLREEYEKGSQLSDAFPTNVLGFQTHRDDFAIDFEEQTIIERISDLRSKTMADDEIRDKYQLKDNRDWKLAEARKTVRADVDWKASAIECLYRPFDYRWSYFSDVAMDYPRRDLLTHVAGRDNLCLGIGKQGIAVDDPEWYLLAVSRVPIDSNIFRRGGIYVFPLYLYESENKHQHSMKFGEEVRPNFSPSFLHELAAKLHIKQSGPFGLPMDISPEDIFGYAYAVFHSPCYRERYAGFLKSDFPRLPLTSDLAKFRKLSKLGTELISMHLLESPESKHMVTEFPVKGSGVVESVRYEEPSKRVWINDDQDRKSVV